MLALQPEPDEMLLIVEDQPSVAAGYTHALSRTAEFHVARSVEHAHALYPTRQWVALVASSRLPDGDGVDMALKIRASDHLLPMLIATVAYRAEVGDRIARLLAVECRKPIDGALLRDFAVQAYGRRAYDFARRLAAALDGWRARYELTPTEKQVVHLRASGLVRHAVAEKLGQRTSTLDRHAQKSSARHGTRPSTTP